MSKTTGLGLTTLSVDDSAGTPQAIKNDITNFQIATPRGVQDVTGVDKSAIERLLLLADFSITLNGVFNPTATTSSHAVFRTVPSSSINRTTTIVTGTTPAATLPNEVLYTDYQVNRAQDGSLVWVAPGVLADGTVPAWS